MRRVGREWLRALEVATRPVPPDLERALARRWEELPKAVRTPAQAIGRRTAGCEGTHGVFPRCDFACTPCYHGREANRVRTDGAHTVAEVDRQMAYLRDARGPGQNAQLIGGEVTLLGPEDHAAALLAMQRHGRKPMSMSHGDFDYDYLWRLAVGADGRPRFDHLSFAGHFDSMMFGRRGVRRVRREADLHPYRARFCEHFRRLERETGITHYLAHNMTVTPANLDQVAEVVRDCRDMGFRMFSFQPAAFMGNASRWKHDYREVTPDAVWAEVERGAAARLPCDVFQIGDSRCNRTAYGAYVGNRWIPFLDDRVPADLAARDAFFATFGGMDFDASPALLAARVVRAFAARPAGLHHGARWGPRFVRRAGGPRVLLRGRPSPVTYVVHNFMDARVVRPAWELLQRGELAEEPRVREAQERLQACSYAMAHPDSDALVPACAQHSVLDPLENDSLQRLLPREERGSEVSSGERAAGD
ncbi:MAG: radical SAM domain-containing protein [Thermoleophilaceae bacterium]|nr:radical SAM domain-containing protein [Thermoleophilaceae bacterium]